VGPILRKRSLSPESEASDISLTSSPRKKRKPSPPEGELIPGTDDRFFEGGVSLFTHAQYTGREIWPGGRFRCTICQYSTNQKSAFFPKHTERSKNHVGNVAIAERLTGGKVVWKANPIPRGRKLAPGGKLMIQLPAPIPVPPGVQRGMVPGVPELPTVDLSLDFTLPSRAEGEQAEEGEVMSIEQAAAAPDPEDPDPDPEPVGTTNKWLGPLLTGLLLFLLAWGLTQKEHTYSRP